MIGTMSGWHTGVVKSRSLLALAVGGLLVALLVGAAVIATARQPETYPPGSPEAVVQGYLQALVDGDEAALESYAPGSAECVDERQLDFITRVVLVDVISDDQEASVEVRVTESPTGGPLDDEDSYSVTLSLLRQDGQWVIDGAEWPVYCGLRREPPPITEVPTTSTTVSGSTSSTDE